MMNCKILFLVVPLSLILSRPSWAQNDGAQGINSGFGVVRDNNAADESGANAAVERSGNAADESGATAGVGSSSINNNNLSHIQPGPRADWPGGCPEGPPCPDLNKATDR